MEKDNTKMTIKETEIAIKFIKDSFEDLLANNLNLTRISAPLFVRPETGINDNLNGVERAVNFDIPGASCACAEIVQSLAKWKRLALMRYGFNVGEGIYTDMNAIRRDEILDNMHSVYVDQWDWEKIISKEERNEEKLKQIVRKLFLVFKETENKVCDKYDFPEKYLPEEITFITTQELEDKYPDCTPVQREDIIAKEKKAVFIMKIGGALKSGIKHDGRAPDYDDWELNGDIIFWYPILNRAFEVSSMGIRVDEDSLLKQLKISGCEERKELDFHKEVLNKNLPYTIGGGIGQSRICMFFLRKAHVGEVQASIWPQEMIDKCTKEGIQIL